MSLCNAVHILYETAQTQLFEFGQWRTEGDLNHAGMTADFNAAGDCGPVLDLRYADSKKRGGALQAIVGGSIEIGTGSDNGDWG